VVHVVVLAEAEAEMTVGLALRHRSPHARLAGNGGSRAILTLAGAFFATFVAWVAYAIECSQEAYSECSNDGRIQLGLAVFGLVLAFADLHRQPPGAVPAWNPGGAQRLSSISRGFLIFGQYVSG
jgi:hypothetical protein